MRRPAFTLIFIGLAALVVTEGFVVIRFLRNASDASQLVAVERQLAQEASGLTRRMMANTAAPARSATSVALEDEEAEAPARVPASSLSVRSSAE